MKRILTTLLVLFLLNGCAMNQKVMISSASNIRTLHHLHYHAYPIALGTFFAHSHLTQVAYIKKQLRHDLLYTGLYYTKAKVKLSAKLDSITLRTMPNRRIWAITMTFNDHQQHLYTIHSAARTFALATRQFLTNLYHSKYFRRTLQSSMWP